MGISPKCESVEVDLIRYEVRRGGRPVHLEHRPMELLILLAQRPGQLVTRDEIIAKLWGKNAFLDTEHGVNTAIRKIRLALHDDPDRPRYLHTVVGKGYRLEGPVTLLGSASSGQEAAGPPAGLGETIPGAAPVPGPGNDVDRDTAGTVQTRPSGHVRSRRVAVASVLLVAGVVIAFVWRETTFQAAEINSVAVLPLRNLSADQEYAYFADVVTEALIADLGQFASLRVISPESIARYKDTPTSLSGIARELGVDSVVQGSVQRVGDRVRITAQLIHVPSETQLWSGSYDRDLAEVLELQTELARAIVVATGVPLLPAARDRLDDESRINLKAYEAYLKGSYEFGNGSLPDAIRYLETAIALAPDFGPAHALMARAYYFRAFYGDMPPHEAFSRMREAALKAVQRDESRADALGSLALVKLHYAWDFDGAGRDFRRALELNPNNADIRHSYAHYLLTLDRVDESMVEMERAFQLDPLGIGTMACHGWHLYAARRYDRSLSQGMDALKMAPDLFWTYIILGWAYGEQGAQQNAIAALQNGVKLMGGHPFAIAALGQGFAAAGMRREAELVLQRLDGLETEHYISAYDRALIYAALDDRDAAFDWLERGLVERSAFLVFITWDPRADSLRSDPRFQYLLKRIGFPEEVITGAIGSRPGQAGPAASALPRDLPGSHASM